VIQEPAAVEIAKSLARHASYLGVDRSQFAVTISVDEAFELIDWLLSQAARDGNLNLAMLTVDADQARAMHDPWIVLNNFQLLGMSVYRRPAELTREQLQ